MYYYKHVDTGKIIAQLEYQKLRFVEKANYKAHYPDEHISSSSKSSSNHSNSDDSLLSDLTTVYVISSLSDD